MRQAHPGCAQKVGEDARGERQDNKLGECISLVLYIPGAGHQTDVEFESEDWGWVTSGV